MFSRNVILFCTFVRIQTQHKCFFFPRMCFFSVRPFEFKHNTTVSFFLRHACFLHVRSNSDTTQMLLFPETFLFYARSFEFKHNTNVSFAQKRVRFLYVRSISSTTHFFFQETRLCSARSFGFKHKCDLFQKHAFSTRSFEFKHK